MTGDPMQEQTQRMTFMSRVQILAKGGQHEIFAFCPVQGTSEEGSYSIKLRQFDPISVWLNPSLNLEEFSILGKPTNTESSEAKIFLIYQARILEIEQAIFKPANGVIKVKMHSLQNDLAYYCLLGDSKIKAIKDSEHTTLSCSSPSMTTSLNSLTSESETHSNGCLKVEISD